jgi:hypothetical protein
MKYKQTNGDMLSFESEACAGNSGVLKLMQIHVMCTHTHTHTHTMQP